MCPLYLHEMKFLNYFKISTDDTFKNAIIKGLKAFLLIAIFGILFTSMKVLEEKQLLDNNYRAYSDSVGEYTASVSKDFKYLTGEDIKVKELLETDYSLSNYDREIIRKGYKAIFSNLGGLTISIFQFNKDNIFTENKYANAIKYKKAKYYIDSETYYKPGNITYDEYGNPNYALGGLDKREVLKENNRETPQYCYSLCLDHFQRKELIKFKKIEDGVKFKEDILSKINGNNDYYYFAEILRPNVNNSYEQNFTSDNFDIDIQTYTAVYERRYHWELIKNDTIFYLLVLLVVPFFYYTRFLVSKY